MSFSNPVKRERQLERSIFVAGPSNLDIPLLIFYPGIIHQDPIIIISKKLIELYGVVRLPVEFAKILKTGFFLLYPCCIAKVLFFLRYSKLLHYIHIQIHHMISTTPSAAPYHFSTFAYAVYPEFKIP